MLDYNEFVEHFKKKDTNILKNLLEQYEWEVKNHLARHDISIEALKYVLNERI